VRGDDAGVLQAGVLDGASLGVVVDVDDAEPLVVAVGLLEVVEERPREVAAHVGARVDRLGDRAEVAPEVLDPLRVVHVPVVTDQFGRPIAV